MLWPVVNRHHIFNGHFNDPRPWGPHAGVDLYANTGDPVVAALPGRVIWASNQRRSGGDSSLGNHVIMEHDNGLITWYGHMNDILSGVGDNLRRGETMGLAGSTGNSTGPHVHFVVQDPGHGLDGYIIPDVLDPEDFLIP